LLLRACSREHCRARHRGESSADWGSVVLLGQARSSRVATIGNAAESKLQWQLIDVLRIISVEPLHNFGMLGMGVSHGVERGVEAGNAAAVFGRTGPFVCDDNQLWMVANRNYAALA
jgi:hypothetical protein